MNFKDMLNYAELGDLIRFWAEKGPQIGRLVKMQRGEGLKLPSLTLMTHQTVYADGRTVMHLVPIHAISDREFELVERLPPDTWRVIDAGDTLKFWSTFRKDAEAWIRNHVGEHHSMILDQVPDPYLRLAA